MNAKERLELIRARLGRPTVSRQAPTGQYCAAKGLPATKPKKLFSRNEAGYRAYDFNVAGDTPAVSDNRPPWVYCADAKKPMGCRVKRQERVSPLTVIAERWRDPETFKPLSSTHR